MTLRVSDEERAIVLRTLKARSDALQVELTQTDSPQFDIQLKHEEETIQALIERPGLLSQGARRRSFAAHGEAEQGSGNGDRAACGAIARGQWPPSSQ